MKKKGRELKPEDVRPDTVVSFEIHDDNCPFDNGKPCICTPTKVEMTVAQMDELFYQAGFRTVGEAVGHGKKRN